MHIPEAFKYVQHLFELVTGDHMEGKENLCLKLSTAAKTCCIMFFKSIVKSPETLFQILITGILVMMEIEFVTDFDSVHPFTKCMIKTHLSHKTKKTLN